MEMFWKLFDLAGGRPLPQEEDGPARRTQLMIGALLASVLFGAIYGLAAGSTDMSLALANVWKVPMVLVLSALATVPATLLTWKMLGSTHRASDLLMGLAAGNFTASLVLAVLAPVVALYYHTSSWAGGVLAMCAATLALSVGLFSGMRGIAKRAPLGIHLATLSAPVVVMVVMQLAVLVQLIHVASPILPEITIFDGGVDSIVIR